MKKTIYEFLDYRDYLKEIISYKKEKTPSFSFRLLGKKIGLKSPAFIAAVVNGTRSLSYGLALRLAIVLNLRNREKEYFVHLVRYNEAKTREEKEFFLMHLMNYRVKQRIKSINLDHCEIYREWYHLAVRELVCLPDFIPDPIWISSKLTPAITATQAARSLDLLKRLGFLKKENGKWIQSEPLLWQEAETVTDARLLVVREYHRKMIALSKEALDRFPPDEREVGALTICISETTMKKIRERMIAFQKEILEIAGQDSLTPEALYQINLQLFPLTTISKDK